MNIVINSCLQLSKLLLKSTWWKIGEKVTQQLVLSAATTIWPNLGNSPTTLHWLTATLLKQIHVRTFLCESISRQNVTIFVYRSRQETAVRRDVCSAQTTPNRQTSVDRQADGLVCNKNTFLYKYWLDDIYFTHSTAQQDKKIVD